MSNNIEFNVSGNSNEWVNWIEEAITKNYFKHYEFKHFSDIQEIGSGGFGKVYRANWKNSDKYFALKSFFNLNNATVKEIVNEVIIIYLKIFYLYNNSNIILFYVFSLNFNAKLIFMKILFVFVVLQLLIKVW
jgi:serine/threonine protein kinase